MRRRLTMIVAATVAALAALLARPKLDAIRGSFRTSSAPGAGTYDALSGLLLSGFYADIAADCATAIAGLPEAAILEIGPGPGRLAVDLLASLPTARWTGLDIDAAMLAAADRRIASAANRSRVELVQGDVASLPFADESFDLVVSSLSAHHWPDATAGFHEIRRVLRPGGVVLAYDLPSAWGRVETRSPGIASIRAAFPSAVETTFRRIGPVELVRRAEARRD